MNFSLDKLAPSIALVIVGLIMLIIGATGVVPLFTPPLVIGEPALKWVFILGGIGLILAGVLLVIREQIKYVAKEENAIKQTKGGRSPRDFGIEVLTPTTDGHTGNSFLVIGTYKKRLPPQYAIWTCTYWGEGRHRKYWPQEKAEFDYDSKEGTWRSKVNHIGGQEGEYKEFLIFAVGPDGNALFEYFKTAGEENKKTVKDATGQDIKGLWPGIVKLTSDISEGMPHRFRI